MPDSEIDAALACLEEEGYLALQGEAVARPDCSSVRSVDLRYLGQAYYLNIPWEDGRQATEEFHLQHEQRYGHRMSLPVELVNIRVAVQGPPTPVTLVDRPADTPAAAAGFRTVVGCAGPVPHYRREELATGQRIRGPAIISEQVATTWLEADWECEVDCWGNLRLRRMAAAQAGPSGAGLVTAAPENSR